MHSEKVEMPLVMQFIPMPSTGTGCPGKWLCHETGALKRCADVTFRDMV